MARLNSTHKRFILERLARYDRPSEIQASIKETYGVDVTLPQLGHYDPETVQGQELAKKWKKLFYELRKRFLENLDSIPANHEAYRLNELQKLYDHPHVQRNPKMRLEILVEIEKIKGQMYTNRHKMEHIGEGGGPIEVNVNRRIIRPDGDDN